MRCMSGEKEHICIRGKCKVGSPPSPLPPHTLPTHTHTHKLFCKKINKYLFFWYAHINYV